MIERRAQQRFPLRLRAQWILDSGQRSQFQSGETADLSSGGVYLLGLEGWAQAGQRIEVSVWLPVAGGEATCLTGAGRVVRIENGRRHGLAIALERMEWLRSVALSTAT